MNESWPSSTRVASCEGEGRVVVGEQDVPIPGDGEILIRTRGCGLCGTDLFKLQFDSIERGMVLGHELVGDVVAIGTGVESVEIGERIVAPHHVSCGACHFCRSGNEPLCPTFFDNLLSPGGFSDYVLLGARLVREAIYRFDDSIPDASALFVEPAGCVVRSVRRAGDLSIVGSTVVVMGGGSMGLLHLLVLKALHPRVAVVIVDPIESRRALALELGASRVAEPGEDATGTVKQLTDGRGADVVFDTVGGSRLLGVSLDLLRGGGTAVLFAHGADGESANFELNLLFKGEKRIVAAYSSSLEDQRIAWKLISSGAMDPSPLVTHRIPLERFDEAVRLMRTHEAIKVMIVPGV